MLAQSADVGLGDVRASANRLEQNLGVVMDSSDAWRNDFDDLLGEFGKDVEDAEESATGAETAVAAGATAAEAAAGTSVDAFGSELLGSLDGFNSDMDAKAQEASEDSKLALATADAEADALREKAAAEVRKSLDDMS